MDNEFPIVHVHGPGFWHNDAYIVGNRQGLEDMKAAIDQALSKGESQAVEYVCDGEGYDLYIQLIDKPRDCEEWKNAALPYTSQDASEKRKDAVWPWDRKK